MRRFLRLPLRLQALLLAALCASSVAWAIVVMSTWMDRAAAYVSAQALAGLEPGRVSAGQADGRLRERMGGFAPVVRLIAQGQVLAGNTAALTGHEVAAMEVLAEGRLHEFAAADEDRLVLVQPLRESVRETGPAAPSVAVAQPSRPHPAFVSVALPVSGGQAAVAAWAVRQAALIAPLACAALALLLTLAWVLRIVHCASRIERYARQALFTDDSDGPGSHVPTLRLDAEEITSRNEFHRLSAAIKAAARAQRLTAGR